MFIALKQCKGQGNRVTEYQIHGFKFLSDAKTLQSGSYNSLRQDFIPLHWHHR